ESSSGASSVRTNSLCTTSRRKASTCRAAFCKGVSVLRSSIHFPWAIRRPLRSGFRGTRCGEPLTPGRERGDSSSDFGTPEYPEPGRVHLRRPALGGCPRINPNSSNDLRISPPGTKCGIPRKTKNRSAAARRKSLSTFTCFSDRLLARQVQDRVRVGGILLELLDGLWRGADDELHASPPGLLEDLLHHGQPSEHAG